MVVDTVAEPSTDMSLRQIHVFERAPRDCLPCHDRRLRELVQHLACLLYAHRRACGTRRGTRALTCFYQALMVLVWFRKAEDMTLLAAGFGISRATAYRYRDEGITVLADQAGDLHTALRRAAADGWSQVILDGKLFDCDRLTETTLSVKGETIDAWFSGKHRNFGASIQAIMRPDGLLIWTAALPGHLYDTSCARELGMTAALNWAAAALDLPTLARRRLRKRRPRRQDPDQATRRRQPARTRQPRLQPAATRPALARRTRLRDPDRTLEDATPHDDQPAPNRRHRRRRATPDPLRVQIPAG